MVSFAQQSWDKGQYILSQRSAISRKAHGQFLTPEPLARFMAKQLQPILDRDRILDPAMGSGTLLCALIDQMIDEAHPVEIQIDGFELDGDLFSTAQETLKKAAFAAADYGIHIHLNLYHADFVLNALQFVRPTLLDVPVGHRHYQRIIANPPYFKINAEDSRRQSAEGVLGGHTNIYTLFMGLAASMLQGGNACFIVPRSFCSGTYFTRFRREFLERVTVQRIHLFETRDDAFSQDDVLQENVVITFKARGTESLPIEVSSSASLVELRSDINSRWIMQEQFVSPLGLFRIPASDLDEIILAAVDCWEDSLLTYGMEISTGPVVAFRAEQYLTNIADDPSSVPLLWMQHIKPQQVVWPLNHGFRKPQYLAREPSLLVRSTNYVLMRRFSAKEEARRLVAAPYLAQNYPFDLVGLENHLNYIYCQKREMSEQEAVGLSALLNSGLIDRYFRISNGNTQVNATELRALPLPPIPLVRSIGEVLLSNEGADLDEAVNRMLQDAELIPKDLPILRETRVI